MTGSNVSGINFPIPQATALICGQMLDTSGDPILSANIYANDDVSNAYSPSSTTFATNGTYCIGVAPSISTNWYVGFDSGDPALTGYAPTNGVLVSLTNGQCLHLNLVFTRLQAPTLSALKRISANQFQFLLTGSAGNNYTYTIQTCTNLNPANWCTLLTTNFSPPSAIILDSQATNQQRFYRAY